MTTKNRSTTYYRVTLVRFCYDFKMFRFSLVFFRFYNPFVNKSGGNKIGIDPSQQSHFFTFFAWLADPSMQPASQPVSQSICCCWAQEQQNSLKQEQQRKTFLFLVFSSRRRSRNGQGIKERPINNYLLCARVGLI